MAPTIWGNSLYVIVDGPSWTEAEANSVLLGGHLVTINDDIENAWIYNTYGQNYPRLHIGLTRQTKGPTITNLAGYADGWISGSNSSWRPPYWGYGGTGGDSIGIYTGIRFYNIYEPFTDNTYPGLWDDVANIEANQINGIAEIPLTLSIDLPKPQQKVQESSLHP